MSIQEEIQNYLRILDAVPTNVPAFEALKKIYTEQESWKELADLYEMRADRLPDRNQAVPLYLQAAAVHLHRLEDIDSAKENIAKALEIEPNNAQALALLRKVAEAKGEFQQVIKILRQQSNMTEDPVKKAELFKEMAKIFLEKLDDSSHAAVAYHQAYILNSDDTSSRDKAIEYYSENGEWQRVIAVLRAQFETEEEPAEKAKLLVKIGEILLKHLEEGKTPEGIEKAKKIFNEALELDPQCNEAREALEELEYESEPWSNLLKKLRKEIRQTKDNERAAFLNYKIAEGYYRRENKPAYAVRYCKQALDLYPKYQKALDLLQELYSVLRKWEALAEFLQDQADKSEITEEKIVWYKKLGTLYREQTKEREREISVLEKILEIKPDDMETLQALENIYREESRFGKALEVMERRLQSITEEETKKSLLTEMAQLAEVELQQLDRAAKYWEEILQLDPKNIEALDALASLYKKQADWESLIKTLQRKLELTEDKDSKAYILRQIGDIYYQRLSLSKDAFDHYIQAVRLNPQDTELTQQLESLARQIGNWDEIIKLYNSILEESEDPADKSALLTRIGEIQYRELTDLDAAQASYEEALELAPNPQAFKTLKELYRRSEKWVELAELLEQEAEQENLETTEKISVLGDLAWVRERQLDAPEEAAEAYEKILQIDPVHAPSLESLERIYNQIEDWENLKSVYQRKIENPASEEELVSTLHILGTLLIEKLDDLEGAAQTYERLRLLDERQLPLIYTRLEQIYRQLKNWEQWVEIARERIKYIRRPEQRKELLLEIAKIQETELQNPKQAIETLLELHQIDPKEIGVVDNLIRLYREINDTDGNIEFLRKKIELTTNPQQKRELLLQLSELYRQKLQNLTTPPPTPIQEQEETPPPPPPEPDPSLTAELEEQIISTYNQILQLFPQDLQAIRSLRAIYQNRGEHHSVLELLIKERSAISDEPEKLIQLSKQIAQLQISLELFPEAIEEYKKILQENPEDSESIQQLEKIAQEQTQWSTEAYSTLEPIYRQRQDWEKLALALENLYRATDDKKIRLQLASEIEEIYRLRLSEDEKAFEWTCQLLRENFEDPEIRERAELMADEMERWDELLAVYETLVRTFVEPEQIVNTYLFIAENYHTRLNDTENAIRNYLRVLDYDQHNTEAIDKLEELYRQTEKWRDLIDILHLRNNLTEVLEEKKKFLFEIAELWEQKLNDDPEAIQALNDLLELDPDDLKAIRYLASLYERGKHYTELAELWERERKLLEENSPELTELNLKLANLYNHQLNDYDRAVQLYKAVLEADIEREEAIREVEELLEKEILRLECARILEPVYLHRENYPKLREVYKIQLDDPSQSASERRKAIMRLGLIHEEKLGEYREAFDRYLQVFTEEPGHPGSREALLRMAEKLDAWRDVVKTFTKGVDHIADLQERINTHLDIAKIYRDKLNDPDSSTKHFRKVVDELDPKNLEAIEALEKYYSQRQDYHALIDILFQKERALSDERDKRDVYYQIAEIYEEKLQDRNQAIAIFQQYLDHLQQTIEAEPPTPPEITEATQRQQQAREKIESLTQQLDEIKSELDELHEELQQNKKQLQTVQEQLTQSPEDPSLQADLEALKQQISELEAEIQQRQKLYSTTEEELEEAEEQEAEASEALSAAETKAEEFQKQFEEQKQLLQNFQLQTIRQLDRLFTAENRWTDLVEILNREVQLLEDPDEAIQLRFRIANIYRDQIVDIPKAIELYRSILDDNPEFTQALQALEELTENEDYQLMVAQSLESFFRDKQQDWTRLIEMIEIQLQHTHDKIKRIEFLKEIVQLYEEELDNPDMGFVYLCRAFREDPTDRETISELERLAEETDAWEELVGVYEDEVESIADPQLALRMYLKIANINDEALQDTEEAILNYRKALELDPQNSAALNALDRLYRQERDWQNLIDILERKLEIAKDSREQITLLSRIATIWERELNALDEAINAYRRILERDPQHHNALSALQRLYQQTEMWPELYEICLQRSQVVESATERTKLKKKMASLCAGPLDKTDEAIKLYEEIIQNSPNDEDSLNALEKLYTQTQRWDDLVLVAEKLLQISSGVERKRELHRTLGITYSQYLPDEEKAIQSWKKVLELDPKDSQALEALRQIYENSERWDDLVIILRRLIPLQEENQKTLQLYTQLATIYLEKLNRTDEAVSSWRRVLELDPSNLQALNTLEELLIQRKDWRSALDILEKKEAVIQEPEEKVQILRKAAQICTEYLREPTRAIPLYEKILQIDPSQLDIIHALAKLYTRQHDWQKLISVKNLEINLLPTLEEKLQTFKEIAKIYEQQLFNKAEAFHTLLRAFELAPLNKELREELERIAEETERWEDLIQFYIQSAQKLLQLYLQTQTPQPEQIQTENETELPPPPPEPQTSTEIPLPELLELWTRIAQIQQYELRDPASAIDSYKTILQLDSTNTEALEALEALYEENEQWYDLIQIYETKRQLTQDIEEQKDLLFKIAEIREYQLSDNLGAIEAYNLILQLDPQETDILSSLEKLYRTEEQWNELIDVLQRRAATVQDPQELFDIHSEIAQTYAEKLQQPEAAIDAYNQLLNLQPENTEVLQALEKLYTETEQWPQLIDILQKRLELATSNEEKVQILYRTAIIWEEELQNPTEAIEKLRQLLEIDPWNLPALKALENLYRNAGDWQNLIDVLERQLKVTEDLSQMAELYFQIGQIYEHFLQDTNRAITYYQRVLDADPFYQPALSTLAKLYEIAGNWAKCIEMMEREARVLEDPEKLVDVYFRIGKLYEERLVQIDRAKDSYNKALQYNPSHLPSIRALKVIYFLQRNWEKVIELAQIEIQYTEEPQKKANLYCEIGKLFRDKLADPKQSAEFYRQALQVNPNHLPAAKPLAELYIEQKEWESAEAVLDHLIGILQQQALSDDLYRYHYLLAYAAENLKNFRKALLHYQESYNLNPDYFPTLDGLGRLYYEQQQWERSLNVYQTILYNHRHKLNERELSQVYCRMGMAYSQMQRPDQAADYFERALEIDPTNPLALEHLSLYYSHRGDWEKALELKERLLLITDDQQKRFQLNIELGNIAYEKLGRPEQAVEFYREASWIQPENTDVLYKLLELFEVNQQWNDKIETLQRLIELHPEPQHKINLLYQIAETHYSKLQDVEKAIAVYNQILDLDYNQNQAFQFIETILTNIQDWHSLDQNYQMMLQRIPQDDNHKPQRLELWKKLGELHRQHIQDIDKAVAAYETVYQLEPTLQNLEILAELYGQKPEFRPKAIEIHHKLLQQNPARIESYKALIRLYYELQEVDKSFAVVSTLRFLRQTSPEEENFYKQMKQKAPDRISRAFHETEVWQRLLFHPNVKSSPLPQIMTTLYQYTGSEFSQPLKQFKVKKSDKVDPNLLFARTYNYVAQVLNLPTQTEVYKTSLFPGLRIVNTFPPIILAGEDMFKERHPKELLFMIARQLTFSRPEFLFASILPFPEFRTLLASLVNLYFPDIPVDIPPEHLDKVKRRLQKTIPQEVHQQLQILVQQYLQNPEPITAEKYVEGVEHTANRVGFCIANDLNISSKVCEREQRADFQIPKRIKVKELVLFSVSEEYFTFRQRQGLAVKP